MAFDLATARIRTGTTTDPVDAQMEAILGTAMAIAEKYCSRIFRYVSTIENFKDLASRTVQLSAQPEVSINSVTNGTIVAPIDSYNVDDVTGVLFGSFFTGKDGISVDYSGGYVTLPLDLELALWGIFDNVYGQMIKTTVTAAAGGISSVTLADVGTVKYDTGAGASTGGAFITPTTEAILDLYKTGMA